jgi:hypothetical protein
MKDIVRSANDEVNQAVSNLFEVSFAGIVTSSALNIKVGVMHFTIENWKLVLRLYDGFMPCSRHHCSSF